MKRRGFLRALLLAPFAKPVVQAAYTALVNYNPIPIVHLRLTSVPIVAKVRRLKANWTCELSQDLQCYHSIDAEEELKRVLDLYETHHYRPQRRKA